MKNWFEEKTKKLSSLGGYQKPELNQDALKLDSNENYVIPKQYQNDIISSARKNSDVREYPLGGVERLIQIISKFVNNVEAEGIQAALNDDDIPLPSMEFMKHTFDLIENGKAHEIASSFAIGRESIVPLMFQRILDQSKLGNDQVPVFRYYLKRHAELDGDHHGPMAHKLLENMSAGNSTIEDEIVAQAYKSIEQRIIFWDGVLEALN